MIIRKWYDQIKLAFITTSKRFVMSNHWKADQITTLVSTLYKSSQENKQSLTITVKIVPINKYNSEMEICPYDFHVV